MAIQGIVGLLVLIAFSSVMSTDINTNSTVPVPDTNINSTVPVSTLDDSSNATTVKPSTILSTSTEMDASNSTTNQPITEDTTTVIPKSTTVIPDATTTTAPDHTRHFDGWSFVGGILLTVGAVGLLLGGYKYFGPGRGDKGVYNRF